MTAVPASPDAAASRPPGEPSVAPTISVPGPLATGPLATVPVSRPDAEGGPSSPATSPLPPPPPAPPAAPPELPEPSRSTDLTPPEATSPAAESNRDQLRPQKPLDVTSPDSDQPNPGQQTNGGMSPGQPSAFQIGVTTPRVKAPPVNRPVGPLAKLRARFHALTHSSAKPASKAAKPHDPTAPAADQPQAVAGVRISLPVSDPAHVAKEEPRTLHGLYPAEEGPDPVSTSEARGPQAAAPPAAATAQENGFVPQETIEKSAATGQIDEWPNGPQAAVSVPKGSSGPAPASDFDSIPVEEYQAAVARAKDDANSVPAFRQGLQSPNEGQQAANVSPPTEAVSSTVSSTAPLAAQPMPAPAESPAIEPRGVPTVDAPPSQHAPPLTQIEQAESPKSVREPGGSSQRVDLQEPVEPGRTTQAASPAPQMSAAPTLLPAEQRPTQLPAVRRSQWIGGRYGQPAWMAAPYAAPAIPRGN